MNFSKVDDRMIVILTQDLMMTSSVSAIARARGLAFKSATSAQRVFNLAAENSISILIIDLQHPQLDLAGLVQGIHSEAMVEKPDTIAYAQHVHVDLLSAARKAGIDSVLTRGQLVAELPNLI